MFIWSGLILQHKRQQAFNKEPPDMKTLSQQLTNQQAQRDYHLTRMRSN